MLRIPPSCRRDACRDVFAEILDKCDVVTTPGSGFGPAGEGFVRASAFAHRCRAIYADMTGIWMWALHADHIECVQSPASAAS